VKKKYIIDKSLIYSELRSTVSRKQGHASTESGLIFRGDTHSTPRLRPRITELSTSNVVRKVGRESAVE